MPAPGAAPPKSCESARNPHGVEGCSKTAITNPTMTLLGHRRFSAATRHHLLARADHAGAGVCGRRAGSLPGGPGCLPRVVCPGGDYPLCAALPGGLVGGFACGGRSQPLGRALHRPRGLTSGGGGLGGWGASRRGGVGCRLHLSCVGRVATGVGGGVSRVMWGAGCARHVGCSAHPASRLAGVPTSTTRRPAPCPAPPTVATTPTPPPP